jgi:hypothetical protein
MRSKYEKLALFSNFEAKWFLAKASMAQDVSKTKISVTKKDGEIDEIEISVKIENDQGYQDKNKEITVKFVAKLY